MTHACDLLLRLIRRVALPLAAAVLTLSVALIPAASAAPGSSVPKGDMAYSTVWLTAARGLVVFGKGTFAGGKPYLFQTANGGASWRRLPMPSDLPGSTLAWDGHTILAMSIKPEQPNQTSPHWRIAVTRDSGRRWSTIGIPGVLPPSHGRFVTLSDPALAHGQVYLLVTSMKGSHASTALYAGAVTSSALRPVAGVKISGGFTYGSLSARGGALQVDLGDSFRSQRYWYSTDGTHFKTAPLPCPAAEPEAFTAQAFSGQPVALCDDGPATVGPGQNQQQVFSAPRLGGSFAASAPPFVEPDESLFTAVSTSSVFEANIFTVSASFDGGHTWHAEVTAAAGGSWQYLAFTNPSTGFVLYQTINARGKPVAYLERSTDGGHTWHQIALP